MARRRTQADPGDDEALLRAMAQALEPWFAEAQRDMPWRRTRDPYAIWVSEIMLQLTRVDTVLRHYDGFLERFPSVAALAAADEQAVLQQWSGLGYYRRARLLHRGARDVVERFAGALPRTAEELRSIPGVGPKIERLLRANGVQTFAQLAACTPDQVRDYLTQGGAHMAKYDPAPWIEEAGARTRG